jgi:hypothetical protein
MQKHMRYHASALLTALTTLVLLGAGCTPSPQPPGTDTSSPQNSTYLIDGTPVILTNGRSETNIIGDQASKTITQYFGNEAVGDVNGDGKPDTVFLLTQTMGGTGTFYYAAVALKTDAGYQGTNAILLGDRIAPQTTEIRDGKIIVNFADRKPDEPFSESPSVGVTKNLYMLNGKLVE